VPLLPVSGFEITQDCVRAGDVSSLMSCPVPYSLRVAMLRVDKSIHVATVSCATYTFHLKGKKTHTIHLPSPAVCMEARTPASSTARSLAIPTQLLRLSQYSKPCETPALASLGART